MLLFAWLLDSREGEQKFLEGRMSGEVLCVGELQA